MKLLIEKDIVPPKVPARYHQDWSILWQMPVNHSILVRKPLTRQAIYGAVWRCGKATGRKFTARQIPEGYRVWRIE